MHRDDEKKREYWRTQMETGFAFMMKMLEYPVEENCEPLVLLPALARKSGVRVVFSRTRRVKASMPVFRLREGLVDGFLRAAEEMNRRGWILRVEDAFRSRAMQNPFHRTQEVFESIVRRILWETGGKKPSPELFFRRMTVLIATIPKIGTHMSGSALDITVLDKKTGKETDRGAPYLTMDVRTFMNSPFVTAEARRNRECITGCMAKEGFLAYPFEFWHYRRVMLMRNTFQAQGSPADTVRLTSWTRQARSGRSGGRKTRS